MSFVVKFLITTLLCSTAFAQDQPIITKPLTGGVNAQTGERPLRLDINKLTGPKLDLYLLALREIQDIEQTNKLSWYQLAGLHGVPKLTYDGVGPHSPDVSTAGYAIHNW